jgi:membrane protein YdbS with pleckstrin-like domain
MLFFALPFYWSSATQGASNRWFVLLVGVLALLSTLDVVFDRFLMRWRALAGVFHAMTIFTALHLVVPALLPGTRTLWVLLAAAALAVLAFWTLHAPVGSLRERRYQLALGLSVLLGTGAVWAARRVIPPVPMYTVSAAVGESTLPDGRLATVLTEAHRSVAPKLVAVTDVAIPGGRGDALVHVWRLAGAERWRVTEGTMEQRRVTRGVLRLRSSMAPVPLPTRAAGPWTVDVETSDGQLVGRAAFTLTE